MAEKSRIYSGFTRIPHTDARTVYLGIYFVDHPGACDACKDDSDSPGNGHLEELY